MIISIVNRSKKIKDEQVQNAIRAINRQIAEDFEPYWSFGARLRLEGAVGAKPQKESLADLRGDAILYLWDEVDVEDALGYHEKNSAGIPYGFVFTELAARQGESWTVTLSHEALELIGDPQTNLLVQGPHPEHPDREVFHWFEMCDAVQSETYRIDGIEVSNFVLPMYFTAGEQEGGRNDFLGRRRGGTGLASFGVAKGGYIGFYDPEVTDHVTYAAADDSVAKRRMALKHKAMAGRGNLRRFGSAVCAKEQSQRIALAAAGGARTPAQTPASAHRRLRAKSAVAGGDPIRHVVVLMLENRSFDHMLGDTTRLYPKLEGIPQQGPRYWNQSSTSGKVFEQQPAAAASIRPDPGHEHAQVLRQIRKPPDSMRGFVDSYLEIKGANESIAGQVMNYYPLGDTPEDDALPVLHALARNFLICDRWFCPMPGPTWPNRLMAHSGTCLGHVEMPTRQHPFNIHLYNQTTIYHRLSDAGKNWRIYHDGIPQSILLSRLLPKLLTSHYRSMPRFFQDVRNPDEFPEYVFIEPRYFEPGENDQHPPSDVHAGERLIADVYNALRASPLWESTLLIVTYDEHGGFFDHVTPPETIAPDGKTKEYSFRQFGPRVPTILVSPWVDPGVCSTTFDHTSILRYLCDKYGMAPLGIRTSPEAGPLRAASFADELTRRDTPRDDAPLAIKAKPVARGRLVAPRRRPPLDGAREALLAYVAALPDDATTTVTATTTRPGRRRATKTDLSRLSDAALLAVAQAKFARMLSPDSDASISPAAGPKSRVKAKPRKHARRTRGGGLSRKK